MFKRYWWSIVIVLAMVLSACGGAATPAPAPAKAEPTKAPAAVEPTKAPAAAPAATKAPEPTKAPAAAEPTKAPAAAAPASKYKEAPMLTDLVKAGKLPPIEQRLPDDPFVVGPGVLIATKDLDWVPGKYGGTIKFAHAVANWNPDIFIGANENLLSAPGIGLDGLRPNVLKDFKVENDNKVFTLTLRKGLKWSDGVPVTTADVKFVYEDIYMNEKITPIFPAKFRDNGAPDGAPMKLDIIDDYTFKVTFGVSYGGFLREISVKGWQGYTDLLRPSHALKPWHIKYTPIEKMADELKKATLTNEWWQLFANKNCNNWDLTNPRCANYPVLYPWIAVPSGSPNLLAFERNPYYYKVDTTGQQLPYADKVISQQVNDVEMLTMKVLNGEVDYVRESTALKNLPLYKENATKAGIQATLMDNHVDPTCLFINYTYNDPTWRKVVNDVRFRQALSFGINRKEIIENIYFTFGQVPTLVPSDYDVAKANKLLDDMGMDKKDADGFRLGPDGKTFVFAIEHAAHAADIAPATELVAQQLKKIGIKATVKQIESGLWGQRGPANEFQAYVIWDVQPMWTDGTWTDYNIPSGRLWQLWYSSGGKQGEEPPAAMKEVIKLHEARIKAVPASDEDKKLYADIRKNYAENVWIIPLAEKVNYAMVSSTKLGNMPKSGQAIGADYSMEQFFFK
jgi:peptide/nickel transport system substrate-binding protein